MCSLIIASCTTAFAEEVVQEFTLEGLVVEGDSTGRTSLPGGFQNAQARFGIMGDKDIMKVPMTIHSLTEKTLAQQMGPDGNLQDVMGNIPGITVGTSPIKTDFSIRGMAGNAALMTYNGIPGFFVMAIGPEDYTIGSMDAIVGPAATLLGSQQSSSGSYSASSNGTPGSINLLTKRALKEDHIKYIQSISGRGNYGEVFDISQRFGKNREWGVRVYGQTNEGALAISGAKINRQNISVDISRDTEKASTNFFYTYFDKKNSGTDRRFSVARKFATVPSAPDNSTNYEVPGMYQQRYGWISTFNHEQKMDKNSSWFVNAGMGETFLRRFIYNGEMNIDEKGNFDNTTVWSQHFAVKNKYIQAGIKEKFKIGPTTHNVTAAIDRSDRTWYNNNQNFEYGINPGANQNLVFGNIYTGISWKDAVYLRDRSRELGKRFSNREIDVSLNIVDDIEIGKWDVMIAGTRRHGNFLSKVAKTQKTSENVHDIQWTPTYGVSYTPNDNTTIYAARAYSISRGMIVGQTESGIYDNEGEYLPSVKTKSDEIGVKVKVKDMFYSLAYFNLKQPNYNTDPNNDKIYGIFGKNTYKGVDFSVTGKLADKWNMFGGFEYLNAKQDDGKPVDGSVKWHGVLGLEYKPTADSSITGRLNYSGKSDYNSNYGVRSLPAWRTFDIFASQKTHLGSMPVTFRMQAYNVFNSNHWIGKTGEGTKFLLSNPRTVVLSAEFDLDKLWRKNKK
ncbi:MAG: TonB-dependent receptor plug domain-containing protein [Phascolarctobacterium sp.]|nr:TonB-dependent receptor plug domain-containing protein [Phascolarctobacterium sp.]